MRGLIATTLLLAFVAPAPAQQPRCAMTLAFQQTDRDAPGGRTAVFRSEGPNATADPPMRSAKARSRSTAA
jgi:hypothetical protein